jgi:hypothetical protein
VPFRHRIDQDNLEIPHNALMKPGFTRLNLAYFADDAEIDWILDALEFIASNGWRFLPLVRSIEHLRTSTILSLSTSTMTRRPSGVLDTSLPKNIAPWLMPTCT